MLPFLVSASAGAESYRTLTTLSVLSATGEQSILPTFSKVELLSYRGDGTVEIEFENQKYVLDRYDFIHSVESQTRQDMLADLVEGSVQAMQDPAQCPLDAAGHLKPGVRWNYAAARLVVEHCPVLNPTVVRRSWNQPWKKSCRSPGQDISMGNTWRSCAPPPACTAAQALLKNAGAQRRLEAWRLRCAGRNVTIPPDKDPMCSLPLGEPHTLVIHQTEGNQTDGPHIVQNFHLDRGWDDIGYHYILSKTASGWRAFEGRIDGTEGSHSGSGLNAQSVAIAVAGSYMPSANRGKPTDQILPTPEAYLLLKSMVFRVRSQYPTIRFIYGHGEYKRRGMGCDTDCPSPSLQQFVNQMRRVYFP